MPLFDAPLRVLHLWAGNLYGGVESFLLTLARQRELCPKLEPHFGLCFEGRLSDELRDTGALVHMLGAVRLSRFWTVWGARRRLRRLLREQAFDAVCCHGCWPHAVFASAVRSAGRPLVFWAHDVPTGQTWVERWARRTAPDLCLANSRLTCSALPRLFPGAPAETVYLPVSPPEAQSCEAARRQVREELHTPEQDVVIVQACRLERWKGHSVLIQALTLLRDVPGWICWFAGGTQRPQEQEYLEELQRQIDGAGLGDRVRFLGHRKDVSRLLAAADVHCQPNTGPEPFGIAFIEALYAGLPVVTTALGGALEIVEKSCGVLTPPGDVGALAAALRSLIEDRELRTTMGRAGPARASALCDPAGQIGRLAELLAPLVCGRAA